MLNINKLVILRLRVIASINALAASSLTVQNLTNEQRTNKRPLNVSETI